MTPAPRTPIFNWRALHSEVGGIVASGSMEPWNGPRWSISPNNFAPEIALPARPVQLHDVTMRDGEECADLAYTVEDKVRIAEALATLGIQRTELFLTVPGWYEAARAIA